MKSAGVVKWCRGPLFATAFVFAFGVSVPAIAASAADLGELSIEELANIEISSVSKRAEPLSSAPAAIYVITNEDIRRSGKTSIPEILRLAPNLQVAGVDASTYAITARGFNSTTANKLLVLIDGRSVYTPLYSGVFWDARDVMTEDVERIEVISGPGGTLWGANAVNGVINIITRSSRDTQGAVVNVGGGNFERGASARVGGRFTDAATWRVYATGFERENTVRADHTHVEDSWQNAQGGFRFDWNPEADTATLQGDIYSGSLDQTGPADKTISGGNVLGRWSHQFSDGSNLQTHVYYDRVQRNYPGTFTEARNTYNAEMQYGFHLGMRHDIILGGGYRISREHIGNSAALQFLPAEKTLRLGNVLAQDGIALASSIKLTLGIKLEHNSYTGWETMPSGRLAWKITDTSLAWLAVSRAVRTPSRIDRDFYSPGVLAGGPNFESEQLLAYELGFRAQPIPRLSFSMSAFYNVYDDLRSFDSVTPGRPLPLVFVNNMQGHTYGVELWGNYSLRDWWRLSAGFNALHEDLKFKPGASTLGGIQAAGNDPKYQFSVRSSMTLSHNVDVDIGVRCVGALPNPRVPAYAAVDGRVAWNVSDHVTLAIAGSNLFNHLHSEFGTPGARSELARTFYVSAQWRP